MVLDTQNIRIGDYQLNFSTKIAANPTKYVKQTCSTKAESIEARWSRFIAGPQSIITFPHKTNPTTIAHGPASQTFPIWESFWKIANTVNTRPVVMRLNETNP